jgi:hypothetical protein
MNRIYTHLDEEDVEKKILSHHGLATTTAEIKPISPVQCPKCHELNSLDRNFCNTCGYALNLVSQEIQSKNINNVDMRISELEKMVSHLATTLAITTENNLKPEQIQHNRDLLQKLKTHSLLELA